MPAGKSNLQGIRFPKVASAISKPATSIGTSKTNLRESVPMIYFGRHPTTIKIQPTSITISTQALKTVRKATR